MNINKFVKDRDEMLMKVSVKELIRFVKSHREFYDPDFVKRFLRSSKVLKEITLHKMIANCTNLPLDFRKESSWWLISRGYSPLILTKE